MKDEMLEVGRGSKVEVAISFKIVNAYGLICHSEKLPVGIYSCSSTEDAFDCIEKIADKIK